MDLLIKKMKLSGVVVDYKLEQNHKAYKRCINDYVQNYMASGQAGNNEVCIDEKNTYYNNLHEIRKIEHDNIKRYYNQLNL